MITIATRGSALALWQTHRVQELLHANGHADSRLEIIRTTGDRITDVPLSQIGDRGLFTRELDAALLDGRADCAVHSLKDIPTVAPDGLVIAAILERADPRDAWLARDGRSTLDSLPPGATVGTSSLRRRALVLEKRRDLVVKDVRGNLDTRLDKLARGDYDALILANAGISRLGRDAAVTALLDPPHWLPAPGQGAIAVVARANDTSTCSALQPLNHYATSMETRAERALLNTLEGGCQVPVGAWAHTRAERITLHALVAAPDGSSVLRAQQDGPVSDPEAVGRELAQRMLTDGADRILAALRNDARQGSALRNADVHAVDLP